MKKLAFLVGAGALCLSGALHAQSYGRYNLEITNSYHPSHEPVGLYIVDFQLTNRDTGNQNLFTYRVYCPTKNVRNISNPARQGKMRTAAREDAAYFEGYSIMRGVVQSVCQGGTRSGGSGLPQ